MSNFRHTRQWWPEFLLDECMPSGRARPEDWLTPDVNGCTAICWDGDNSDRLAGTMSPGEILAFMWHEKRGTIDITVMPDGTWKIDDIRASGVIDMFTGEVMSDVPMGKIAEANQFAEIGNPESMADSLDAFAKFWADAGNIDPQGETVTVEMGYWRDGLKYQLSADGRTLAPIGGDHG